MPLLDLNLAQTWRQMYDFNAEPGGHPPTRAGVRIGYLRCVGLPIARLQVAQIVAAFGWSEAPAPALLIFSAGFGFHIEALKELPQFAATIIVGVDTSTYVNQSVNMPDGFGKGRYFSLKLSQNELEKYFKFNSLSVYGEVEPRYPGRD